MQGCVGKAYRAPAGSQGVRAWLVLPLLLTFAAGCAGSYSCPEVYGPEFREAYLAAVDELAKNDIEIPDADRDCVPDPVEAEYGTDPNDASSFPSLEQLGGSAPGPGSLPGPGIQGNATAKPPVVKTASGTITAAVGVNGGASFTLGGASAEGNVEAGARFLLAELSWDGVADLDLCVGKPASGTTGPAANCDGAPGTGGLPGMPDSPIAFVYTNPEAGAWSVGPYANGPVANTAFTVAFTVFYDETEIPAGYTAL